MSAVSTYKISYVVLNMSRLIIECCKPLHEEDTWKKMSVFKIEA